MAGKADGANVVLAGWIPNIGGPKVSKTKILMSSMMN